MRKFLSRLRTPIFSNTGSTARDHLASERTFLAWIRTGLGFIALGIAVERFSNFDLDTFLTFQNKRHDDHTSKNSHAPPMVIGKREKPESILVSILLGTGSGSIVYGTTRYFVNLRMIERGLFVPAFHGVAGLSVSCAVVAGAAYWGMARREVDQGDRFSA